MADPFSIGGAVALGGLSLGGSIAQNQSIRKSMRSTVEAAAIQQQQLALRAALEKRKRTDEARRVVGALRVAGGESGGVAGSYAALIRAADADAQTDLAIVGANYSSQAAAVSSDANARLQSLRNQMKIPILEGAMGAIQGAMLGNAAGGLFQGGGAVASTGFDAGIQIPDFAGVAAPPMGALPAGLPGQIIL